MTAEPYTSPNETEGDQYDEARARRRDWRREGRRWLEEKAEAWDPDRWKAMAAAFASMWQDGTDGARPERPAGAATETKICPYCAEEIKPAAIKCKHCGTWLVPPPEASSHGHAPAPADFDHAPVEGYAPPRRLTRSNEDAMVHGVLGGLGRFFGIDPTWLRIAFALGTFFTAVVPGIIVYGILSVIIPGDPPVKGEGFE